MNRYYGASAHELLAKAQRNMGILKRVYYEFRTTGSDEPAPVLSSYYAEQFDSVTEALEALYVGALNWSQGSDGTWSGSKHTSVRSVRYNSAHLCHHLQLVRVEEREIEEQVPRFKVQIEWHSTFGTETSYLGRNPAPDAVLCLYQPAIFDSEEEAHAAYVAAIAQLNPRLLGDYGPATIVSEPTVTTRTETIATVVS